MALLQETMRVEDESILPLAAARDRFYHDYRVRLLRMTRGNVTQASRMAQCNRTVFYKMLQRYELTPAHFKGVEESPEDR